MSKLLKRHAPAFYRAQARVKEVLEPYHARCINQYVDEASAFETFTLYSPEPDLGDDGRRLRGCIAVWYGVHGDECSVVFFVGEELVAPIAGLATGEVKAWSGTGALLERLVPALPKIP